MFVAYSFPRAPPKLPWSLSYLLHGQIVHKKRISYYNRIACIFTYGNKGRGPAHVESTHVQIRLFQNGIW